MKRKSVVITFILFFAFFFLVGSKANNLNISSKKNLLKKQDITSKQGVLKPQVNFAKVPLYFIHNQGQVHKKALFYAKASRYTLWVTKEGLVFDSSSKKLRDVSRLMFLGANKNPKVEAIDPSQLKVNFFIGNDKSKWQGGVPTSGAVLYKELYKNIDLKVYGIEKEIEYDWIVKPGGDPAQIRMAYQDVKATRINKEGNLVITTKFGDLVHKKPVSYQWHDAKPGQNKKKVPITASFKKMGKKSYGFTVGSYDKSRPLIIDPVVLAYSTYLGGSNDDRCTGLALDNKGHVFVTGTTHSDDFPISTQSRAGRNTFITGFDTNQAGEASLLYATYFGSTSSGLTTDIAIDNQGIIYISGTTSSTDFPTVNAYQEYNNGKSDAFVAKIDPTLKGAASILYSTYLGGESGEESVRIAVDENENVYVAGNLQSLYFPTFNQFQGNQGDRDTFVAKLDTKQAGVASLLYSTYLGGSGRDYLEGLAIDDKGHAYLTGYTDSIDFPTRNEFQNFEGSSDGYVTVLDTNKSGDACLVYSTHLGSHGNDITLDHQGYVYIVGTTGDPNFPTINPYQDYTYGYDIFISMLDITEVEKDCLIYSSFFGGTGNEYPQSIAVDNDQNVYITGYTWPGGFPLLHEYQRHHSKEEAFVFQLDTKLGKEGLVFSTYLGGDYRDYGQDIALDSGGNIFLCGYTMSSDFPVQKGYQQTIGQYGEINGFIARMVFNILPVIKTVGASNITFSEALARGKVTGDGGSAVTNRGICVATHKRPDLGNSIVISAGSGLGEFSCQLVELTPATTYYFRAFATNASGTGYGRILSFKTLELPKPVISGKVTAWGTGVAGVKIQFSDNGGQAITDQLGNYSHIVPYNWTGTATPVKEGYLLDPQFRNYENLTTNRPKHNYTAYNLTLSLQANRRIEKALLVSVIYGEIILHAINPGNMEVDKYILYRKTGDGNFQVLTDIPGSQLQSSYTYIDKFLEEKISYTYKFTALAPDGTILATSPEKTI